MAMVLGYWQLRGDKPMLQKTPGSESPLDMVLLPEYIPGLVIDLRYAGANNVFQKPVYSEAAATLRRGTADKLKAAESQFEKQGFHLKVWDAYRPLEVQKMLWQAMPDERFVVNPQKSISHHCRGAAVDVTLVDQAGRELIMPSDFDEFSARGNRDYSDIEPQAAENARILEKIMKENGFTSIFNEWWHFVDNQAASYPVNRFPEEAGQASAPPAFPALNGE